MDISTVAPLIRVLRGQRVILDRDLAALYGAKTGDLNRAVMRDLRRFPSDFMFQITAEESVALRFQSGTSKKGRGGSRYLPRAFSEQGVAMLSSVLRSERAILVNIEIMRAFVRFRQVLESHKDLDKRMSSIERRLLASETALGEHNESIKKVFETIRRLIAEPEPPRKKIGFSGG